jgi:type II secretory pathway pseudopilin PulG
MTLIELALVLSLTGALLAMFIPTFWRRLSTSKINEAVERLDAMHRHAASYYARTLRPHGDAFRACLPDSAGPYPERPSADRVEVDFALDEAGAATWKALGQSPAQLRYSYQVEIFEPGCVSRSKGPALILRAQGDLDGDGATSLLERSARSDRDGLIPQGPLRILSRSE